MNRVFEHDEEVAHKAIELLELTSLNADDSSGRIISLCERAITPVGNVAAVCVLPAFAGLARRTLDSLHARDIRVVAAVNFPGGGSSIAAVEAQTQAAMLAGADEIDLVYPVHAQMAGYKQIGSEMIAACKAKCGRRGVLAVTLDTGVMRDPQIIHTVCRTTIREGATFVKTNAGRQTVSTSQQAARILIEAIAELGAQIGIKASGNVRTLSEARSYLELVQARFGARWLESQKLRLSANSLLDDLLAYLGVSS